jgi:hypothetical protein
MFGENYVNVPFDQSQGTNMFLRVINIKIMLNTNILGMTPTPLTFDMLHHHDLEKGRYPTAQYSLPYFTDSVKYPMDYLTSKTYSERVDFFFNKKRFNTMCRNFGTNYIDYGDGNDDEEEDDKDEGVTEYSGEIEEISPVEANAKKEKEKTELEQITEEITTRIQSFNKDADENASSTSQNNVKILNKIINAFNTRNITNNNKLFERLATELKDYMQKVIKKEKRIRKNTLKTSWRALISAYGKPFWLTEPISGKYPELRTKQKENFEVLSAKLDTIENDPEILDNRIYQELVQYLKDQFKTQISLFDGKPTRTVPAPSGGNKQDPEKLAKQEMENADHNVRCMLILLLPIADEFMNVFQSSYDQYILNKPSPELYTLRNIDPTMLLNPTWLPFYNYFAARKYAPPIQEISYIKQGGAKYAVASVIWLNDIVNHPIYREFLTTYYEKNLEKQNNRPKIKTQLTERLQMFRGLIQRNQLTKNSKTTLFMQMFETLLQNVNITPKGTGRYAKTPSEQIESIIEQFGNDATPDTAALTSDINKTVSAVTNPKDAAKRDSVIKMATSFAKIIATNNKLKQNGKLSNADWFSMADNIVSAYIEYSLYNESADKGMQINLKDDARNFTELYNQSLFIKAIQLIDDFLHNRISRFDMNEKNLDGTPKSKLELDIIRIIQKSFPYYIKLNDDIVKHLRNVLEPRRRSSNAKLQSFLKNMFIPDNTSASSGSTSSDDQYALVEIYNKYIANTRKHIHKRFTDELMYTGVNTIVESDGSPTNTTSTTQKPVETPSVGNKPSGGDDSKPAYREIPEIYVYVNVVQKDEYEGSDNRACIMSDDVVANNLKRVLFTNTMLDDSFPEVNPYRVFQFLKGSENKTPFNAENMTKPLVEGNVETNKSNSQSPTPNVVKGGSKRPSRNTYKYVPKRFVRRNTRKHR